MINFVKNKIISKPATYLLFTLACVITTRLMIYQWLHSHGYFYGIPWDSFSRTYISYEWSKEPFFTLSDGYWLPLQFWIVGSVYAIIRPLISTSEIFVPVFINNLFFIGSITVLYSLTLRLIQKPFISFAACLLAGIYAGDVFVSYSALSEPMLIFFILLASYYFYIMHTGEKEDHPRRAILLSPIICFAAATHYIGWFLACFFCFYLIAYSIYAAKKKAYSKSLYYFFAILICSAFPIVWLYNNFSLFGDPFYPLQHAKHLQAAFIGGIKFLERIFVTPLGVIEDFLPISIPGLMAAVFLLNKKPKYLLYLIPGGFVFMWIWLSTAMAFSATNQEPRYLVYVGWLLIPIIAVTFYYLWNKNYFMKSIVVIASILIVGLNLWQINSFWNSFDSSVQKVAYEVGEWFENHPGDYEIILNQDSFAETGVIPVISGYPDRIMLVSNEEFPAVFDNQINSKKEISGPWLLITKNKPLAKQAISQGFSAKKIGVYYLISVK